MTKDMVRQIEELLFANRFCEAAELCRRGVAADDPVALTLLGNMHELGWIQNGSVDHAITLYRRAITHGYPLAFFKLGTLYLQGMAQPEFENEAEELLSEADRLGHVPMAPQGPPWVTDE